MDHAATDTQQQIEEARRQARVDLAAAHRLADLRGLNEGIFNHLTLNVPGAGDRYYQIPFGLHWSEVHASCFMEVDFAGRVCAGAGEVEQSCYAIHAPLHRLLPQAVCVMHTHMPFASALTRLKDPRLKPIGQTEVGVAREVGYDMDYTGPAVDTGEGERLATKFGDKSILFMANHGVATIGRNVAQAFDRLYYLERAAQVQLYAMWTGQPLLEIEPQRLQQMQDLKAWSPDYGGLPAYEHHFRALRRMLDRTQPDYRD